MKKWICKVCGYIHTGEAPPSRCPVCGSPASEFAPHEGAEAAASHTGDARADILVVGSGAAAFAAAITARAAGASVIMLEKAARVGGTTARSGGGFWVPGNRWQAEAGYKDNREACLRYMARYSYPHLYNPAERRLGLPDHEYSLLEAYVDNAHKMAAYFGDIGALSPMVEINWTGRAQVDYMDHLPENMGIRGRSIYPKTADGKIGYGVELIAQLSAWCAKNGVEIKTGHQAVEILRQGGRVTGLLVEAGGRRQTYAANKGVIFGSGGFSHNPALMLRLQRGPHFGGCSVPENTGDFIHMAGQIGAQLGNTAGAFRADSMLEAALRDPGGSSNIFYIGGDSVIIVNRYGERVCDEKRNYTDRAMTHFVWDPQRAEWKNMLTFLIYDRRTASLWQGFPPYPTEGEELPWIIKGDTLIRLTKAIEERLEGLETHTGGFHLDGAFAENLVATVSRFNRFAATGEDLDFHRGSFAYDREWTTFPPTVPGAAWPESNPNITMYPIGEGPYYAIILAAGTLDTNGGPVVDSRARVLDWHNKPIPGLYGAGNCVASPTANAYWGAGSTIGPAMTFGYLAARDACLGQK